MVTLNFPPPSNSDDFDRVVRQIAELKFGVNAVRHGRSGQAQHGVDITLTDAHDRLIGIQSKNTIELTTTTMDSEIAKLPTAPFTLQEYIFATAAPSATHHTEHALKLSAAHAPLKVTVWAWGHINDLLNSMPSVALVYAASILPPVDSSEARTQHARYLRRAMDRPALLDGPYAEGNFQHQCDALRDVLGFLATGNLYDRHGILAFSVLPYHEDDSYGPDLETIKSLLKTLLGVTQRHQQSLNRLLQTGQSSIDLFDSAMVKKAKLFGDQNDKRRAILKQANKIFDDQNLERLPM